MLRGIGILPGGCGASTRFQDDQICVRGNELDISLLQSDVDRVGRKVGLDGSADFIYLINHRYGH